jgi:ATP-dependent helicase/nuclease subunit A
MSNIKIISAGAGSGKTYRLTQEMVGLLRGGTRASGIIATTFTAKAAAELQERVSTKLLEEGLTEQANDLSNALIGTVHGLGVKLLRRFAFEAGVSPKVDIIADEDQQIFFNLSLAHILTIERTERLNDLCDRLGFTKKGTYDWRKDIRQIVDVARANAFDRQVLEQSKVLSFNSFCEFLGVEDSGLGLGNTPSVKTESDTPNTTPNPQSPTQELLEIRKNYLIDLINVSIELLSTSGDETKVTTDGIGELKTIRNELRSRGSLYWHQWVKLTKTKVGAKSREHLVPLVEYTASHTQFPDFQQDIKDYIFEIFDIAADAIDEYDTFKKKRGLIDYTDMEVLVRELLKDDSVKSVLADELDLLMVDEFQDTSPIQLDIFLKLANIAKFSIWVGDPKQSIYGFRGAEPRLMQAIIEHVGIKDEDILKDSWRSRADIVYATNALFCKAFQDLPTEQVALNPKRQDKGLQTDALVQWHFQFDDGGNKRSRPNADWLNGCIAETVKRELEKGIYIVPKGQQEPRVAQAGDVAVLCRTNDQCLKTAEALHRAGLKAAIARTGLLQTAEATLIVAILRYILNRNDSLAVAEIMLFAERYPLSDIIEHRLQFLEEVEKIAETKEWQWAHDNEFIDRIYQLRRQISELSANEILNLVLEELDVRRIIASWGNAPQRLANVEVIRKFSLQYENACNRLHTAASLGGFLLWLAERAEREEDTQSSGESADAVNVLTYHRSKGLEYPIVVMSSLEQNLRNDVFGIAIQSTTEGVNLDDILGNRWLRFWVNPYADQFRNTELDERINTSDAKAQATLAALGEEARLLYVGVTRARDYLVFPTYTGGITKWLNRAWHNGKEEFPTLEDGNDTPFVWGEKFLTKDFVEEWFSKDFGYFDPPTETSHFIEPRDQKRDFLSYKLDVEKESWTAETPIKATNTEGYAAALPLKEDANAGLVARVFEAFLVSDDYDSSAEHDLENERFFRAKNLVERFGASEMIDFQAIIRQTNSFYDWLERQGVSKQIGKRLPIRGHRKGRLYEFNLDGVFEKIQEVEVASNTQLSIFDQSTQTHNSQLTTHNSTLFVVINDLNATDGRKAEADATRHNLKFSLAKPILQKMYGAKEVRCFVHAILAGALVEVTHE